MKLEIKDYASVETVSWWGSDKEIARIARVSTGSLNKGTRLDRKLLRTLLENDHGSPLEFGGMVYRLKLPLYLVAQLQRHRMASYSQRSGRYVEMSPVFYAPREWRQQGEGNKQTSGEPIAHQDIAAEIYSAAINEALDAYNRLLDLGVSREQARIVLPLSTETELYAQFNLRSLMNFLRLRLASDAQGEIREYAETMFSYFTIRFPLISELFDVMLEVDKDLAEQRHQLWSEKVAKLEGQDV